MPVKNRSQESDSDSLENLEPWKKLPWTVSVDLTDKKKPFKSVSKPNTHLQTRCRGMRNIHPFYKRPEPSNEYIFGLRKPVVATVSGPIKNKPSVVRTRLRYESRKVKSLARYTPTNEVFCQNLNPDLKSWLEMATPIGAYVPLEAKSKHIKNRLNSYKNRKKKGNRILRSKAEDIQVWGRVQGTNQNLYPNTKGWPSSRPPEYWQLIARMYRSQGYVMDRMVAPYSRPDLSVVKNDADILDISSFESIDKYKQDFVGPISESVNDNNYRNVFKDDHQFFFQQMWEEGNLSTPKPVEPCSDCSDFTENLKVKSYLDDYQSRRITCCASCGKEIFNIFVPNTLSSSESKNIVTSGEEPLLLEHQPALSHVEDVYDPKASTYKYRKWLKSNTLAFFNWPYTNGRPSREDRLSLFDHLDPTWKRRDPIPSESVMTSEEYKKHNYRMRSLCRPTTDITRYLSWLKKMNTMNPHVDYCPGVDKIEVDGVVTFMGNRYKSSKPFCYDDIFPVARYSRKTLTSPTTDRLWLRFVPYITDYFHGEIEAEELKKVGEWLFSSLGRNLTNNWNNHSCITSLNDRPVKSLPESQSLDEELASALIDKFSQEDKQIESEAAITKEIISSSSSSKHPSGQSNDQVFSFIMSKGLKGFKKASCGLLIPEGYDENEGHVVIPTTADKKVILQAANGL